MDLEFALDKKVEQELWVLSSLSDGDTSSCSNKGLTRLKYCTAQWIVLMLNFIVLKMSFVLILNLVTPHWNCHLVIILLTSIAEWCRLVQPANNRHWTLTGLDDDDDDDDDSCDDSDHV